MGSRLWRAVLCITVALSPIQPRGFILKFPPISYELKPPSVVWRGKTARELPDDLTAAAVIRHDADTSGRVYEFAPEFWTFLAGLPWESLLWVTFTRDEAARYAAPGDVIDLPLDVPAAIIATDNAGGFLLLFGYVPPSETGAATMDREAFSGELALEGRPARPFDDAELAALGARIDIMQRFARDADHVSHGHGYGPEWLDKRFAKMQDVQTGFDIDLEKATDPADIRRLVAERKADLYNYGAFILDRAATSPDAMTNGPEWQKEAGGYRERATVLQQEASDDPAKGNAASLTLAMIDKDPLAAIYAPLPERPSFELLNAALGDATKYWSRDDALGHDASARVGELFAADQWLLAESGATRAPLGVNPDFWAEEERKKHGRGSGSHAQLAHNIRPDVEDAPGGLVVVTTAKNSERNKTPEREPRPSRPDLSRQGDEQQSNPASDWLTARLDRIEARLSGATQTPEAQHDPKQPATDRTPSPPMLTLEAIAADPWNAVELPLPPGAGKELLTAAREAAAYSHATEHHLMMEARAGRNTEHWSAELHAAGVPQPDIHEYNENRWFQAETRLDEIDSALEQIEGRGDPMAEHREEAQQRYADESSRRQETERRAASGEEPLAEARDDATANLIAKLDRIERKAEREADEAREALNLSPDGTPQGKPKLPTGRDL